MPQNRLALHQHFISKSSELWSDSFAEGFIYWKVNQLEKNDFNKNWNQNSSFSDLIGSDTVSIFLSSSDEFVALGNSWKRVDGLDQYSALIRFVSNNLFAKSPFIIRCHPNLVTKSLKYVLREIKFLFYMKRNFFNVKIILPTLGINSYQLVKNSKNIIVWDSTIGLEAAALGKTVINLAPSLYNLSIDTIDLSMKHFTNLTLNLSESSPNKNLALNFINFLYLKNKGLDNNLIQNSAIFRMGIVSFASGGGTPYLFDRIVFSFNVLLNRMIFGVIKIFMRSVFY